VSLGLAGLVSGLDAQLLPLGDEIEVSRPGPYEQNGPTVAADRAGGWGVAWSARDSSDFSVGVGRIRLLDRDSGFISGSLRDFELEYPDIGLDGEGRIVVVGLRPRPELGGVEVGAQCLDSTGRPRADSVRVDSGNISPGTRVPWGATVAVDTDGSFVVAWQEDPQVLAPPSVFFRRFDADCGPLESVQSLGAVGVFGRREPRVARTPSGGFALVWLEGWLAELPRVATQLFDGQGDAVAPAFVEPHAHRLASSPRVAVAPSGEVAVTWKSDAESSSSGLGNSLFGRVFGSDGVPLGSVLSLRAPRELQAAAPDLVSFAGAFLAIWFEGGVFQTESAVYGRRFDANAPIHGEYVLRGPDSAPAPRGLRIAALSDSELALVWTTPYVGSTRPRIVARRYGLVPQPTGCIETATALCLGGGRFRVTVEWRDFEGNRGQGRSRPLTADSGLFWFFDDSNLELLVKTVDACAEFGHHWLFAAATTNAEYTLRVTDTATGRSRSYFNRLGVSSPAITDSDAFSTCP
jgi:hypothetical protein